MKKWVLLYAISFQIPAFAVSKTDSCFPKNNLYLEDRLDRKDSNIDERTFYEKLKEVEDYYSPIVSEHQGRLEIQKHWKLPEVNAYALQDEEDDTWGVVIFGGLARRPELTVDGLTMVACHEIGHHLGGYPFYGIDWASSEGQADYFASHSCVRNIWKDQKAENALFRKTVSPYVKQRCDASHSDIEAQDLCYRSAAASLSVATLLTFMDKLPSAPEFNTPDLSQIPKTQVDHPKPQCRLDTYFAGSLCLKEFDQNIIPGKTSNYEQLGEKSEKIATQYSCMRSTGDQEGLRPRCWFAPLIK